MPLCRNWLVGLVSGLLAIALTCAVPSEAFSKRRGAGKGKADKPAAPDDSEKLQRKAGAGSAADAGPPVIDVERVLQHASALATDIGARPTNSEQARSAAAYISAELAKLGLEPEVQDVGLQVAPAIDLAPFFTLPEFEQNVTDPNLVLRFAAKSYAKDSPLLFMAHYDSVFTSPGAVDNAVSVGLLLELARVLVVDAPTRRVIIAFTASEEQRLLGARALAETLGEDLGLAVSLDLVGGPGTLTLNGLSSLIGRGWLMWFAEVSKQAKIDLSAPWLNRVVSQLLPEVERSDHGPFTARGIPAIHLYHRADEVFLAYHTRHDTMSSVDADSVADAGKFIEMMTRTAFAFPKPGGGQGLWVPFPGSPKVASALAAQALELMFLLFGIMSIARLSRDAKEARSYTPRPAAPEGRRFGLGFVLTAFFAVSLVVALVVHLASGGDHSQPWAHSPFRYIVAALLMAAALGYLLAVQLGRIATWKGDARYLVMAIAWTGLLGFLMLSFSVFELAWIFLWPAAALGGMARVKSRAAALVLLLLAALPLLGVFSSAFLREAIHHGFFPGSLPLTVYGAVFLLPYTLALVFVLRRWPLAPGGSKVAMPVCGAMVVIAIVLIASHSPPCSGKEFKLRGLACEIEK